MFVKLSNCKVAFHLYQVPWRLGCYKTTKIEKKMLHAHVVQLRKWHGEERKVFYDDLVGTGTMKSKIGKIKCLILVKE